MGLEILYGLGAVALLAALGWGTWRYRQRTFAEKQQGDRAARELFRDDKS